MPPWAVPHQIEIVCTGSSSVCSRLEGPPDAALPLQPLGIKVDGGDTAVKARRRIEETQVLLRIERTNALALTASLGRRPTEQSRTGSREKIGMAPDARQQHRAKIQNGVAAGLEAMVLRHAWPKRRR